MIELTGYGLRHSIVGTEMNTAAVSLVLGYGSTIKICGYLFTLDLHRTFCIFVFFTLIINIEVSVARGSRIIRCFSITSSRLL